MVAGYAAAEAKPHRRRLTGNRGGALRAATL
jgi:hypothetical protein